MTENESEANVTDIEDVITRDESGHERYETEALSKGGDSDE